MARNRTLKPGFFTNEDLCSLPFADRLLFAGLWTLADRSGRLEDRPKRIHAELFPYDAVLNVDAMLSALENSGFIYRYLIGESRYIQVACFFKHQTPHPHEIASKIQPIPFDLADSKACRDFSRQCRDMSYQAPSGCPSGSSGSSGSSSLQDLQDLHPDSSGKPPEESSAGFALESPSGNGMKLKRAAKPEKPKKVRPSDSWPAWKKTAFKTLISEDPKKRYCSGSDELFDLRVRTEVEAAWLIQVHREQIAECRDFEHWEGFYKWLKSAITLMDSEVSASAASAPARKPDDFDKIREWKGFDASTD